MNYRKFDRVKMGGELICRIMNAVQRKRFGRIFLFAAILLCAQETRVFAENYPDLSGKYKGYNVILIICDALRPDHLSCYGYDKKTSANIDALSQKGIMFENAFSQASYTIASVTSIFTSVYPYSHRTVNIFKDKVPEKIDTLAQILALYGYKTVWFGRKDDPHSGRVQGLLKGFGQQYDFNPPRSQEKTISSWLKSASNQPFFMTIHSYVTHEEGFLFDRVNDKFTRDIPHDFIEILDTLDKRCWDYLRGLIIEHSPAVYGGLGEKWIEENKKFFLDDSYRENPDSIRLTQSFEQKMLLEGICKDVFHSLVKSFDKNQRVCFISLCDSAVYEMDKNIIGNLVKELTKLNLYDKTIIVLTADHGNEYLEHGNLGHGQFLYEESIHVPLIFYIPGLKKKALVKELAQSIDIFPTILDLLLIPAAHQAQGISILGLMKVGKGAPNNEYVFSQSAPGLLSIRSKEWKFIENGELFNLKSDPFEKNNLISTRPEIVGKLRVRLESLKKNLVIYQQENSDFEPGISEEIKERIRKTGYW